MVISSGGRTKILFQDPPRQINRHPNPAQRIEMQRAGTSRSDNQRDQDVFARPL
jgi:hypothetical protein